jgi:hypothetical protein
MLPRPIRDRGHCVGVDVIAPVVVAALVSGSDAVVVINARKRGRNLRRW